MKWNKDNLPNTKEEWAEFRTEDPQGWGDATQGNVDRMFRENKEKDEKITGLTNINQNLQVEVDGLKTTPPKDDFSNLTGDDDKTPPPPPPPEDKKWNKKNLPQSKDDWDNFFIDSPTEANDLRQWYLNNQADVEKDFQVSWVQCTKEVQEEHPDMYLPELDEGGQVKKDDKGKVIVKIDSATSTPFFNPKSEKGKLWEEIWNEDPQTYGKSKTGPRLIMAEMERRLRIRGQKMVDANQEEKTNDGEKLTAPPGNATPPAVKLTFKDDEEKAHAQKMVERGTYTSLEDFCKHRDTKSEGIYDESSTPSFS